MRQRRAGRVRYVVAHPGAELYGSDRVMLESVIGFVQSGADVVVALPETGPLVEHLESAGARVQVIPTLVLRKSLLRPRNWGRLVSSAVRGSLAARRLLKEHAPDAVYVSTMTLPLWPFAASVRRTPSLVHVHEAEQGASRIVKTGIYAPALLARDVVVNSEFSRGVLAAAFPKLAARAQVVYNGVAGPASTTPARHEIERPVRLVYIGRLSPRKGPDLIVEAIATLPASLGVIELDIVGDVFTGYEWFDEQLRARIDELGLSERVRLLGFRPQVWDAVDACDIVVIPSRLDEPFGNTAVEGVLAGRPVLVSDTSGLREATAGVATVIRFAPDDVASLAAAITEAVERWTELEPQLASEAQGAEERFSIERYRAEIADRLAAITR
ncbi:glycosyltransferase [Planococcus sp. APC 4015]|nr:glycosyltransferase [Planococcus sp. APC 4015]